LTARRKSIDEGQRTIRGQLTDVLGKLTALQLEAAKLQHEVKDDRDYLFYVNNVLGQQNGFLLDQAMYLSKQIPSLVTTYELNTIALANVNAGNLLQAEEFYVKAIEIAPSEIYEALSVRSYALFLYPQGRLQEGRQQFRRALDLIKGEDNHVRWQNGLTHQLWAVSELNFARSPERANEHFENARNEYASIDAEAIRNQAFASLDAARRSPGSQPPMPNISLQTDTPQAARP
jgi:tetratricopeptide (TPR) repeat protein